VSRRAFVTVSCDYSGCAVEVVVETAGEVEDLRAYLSNFGWMRLELLDLCPEHAWTVRYDQAS
jgi:hypothetical protein